MLLLSRGGQSPLWSPLWLDPLDDELGRAVFEGVVLVEVNVGTGALFCQVHEDVRQGDQSFAVRGS